MNLRKDHYRFSSESLKNEPNSGFCLRPELACSGLHGSLAPSPSGVGTPACRPGAWGAVLRLNSQKEVDRRKDPRPRLGYI